VSHWTGLKVGRLKQASKQASFTLEAAVVNRTIIMIVKWDDLIQGVADSMDWLNSVSVSHFFKVKFKEKFYTSIQFSFKEVGKVETAQRCLKISRIIVFFVSMWQNYEGR
jgi:hypothetical protein